MKTKSNHLLDPDDDIPKYFTAINKKKKDM
jgi:hypothetical protein